MKLNKYSFAVAALLLFLAILPSGHTAGSRQREPSSRQNGPSSKHPRQSKVIKRSGSLPRPPTRPVYHSPPINAFSLSDLEPKKDRDQQIKISSPQSRQLFGNYNADNDAFDPSQYSPVEANGDFGRSNYNSDGESSGEIRYFSSQGDKNRFNPVESGHTFKNYRPSPGLTGISLKDLNSALAESAHNYHPGQNEEDYSATLSDIGLKYNSGLHSNPSLSPEEFAAAAAAYFPKPTASVAPKLLVPTYDVKHANIYKPTKFNNVYHQQHHDDHHDEEVHHDDAHYDFSYEVAHHGDPHYGKGASEGQFFGHSEKKEGPITRGRYHVLLPDGRHQKVAYRADHSGYHAQVSYH